MYIPYYSLILYILSLKSPKQKIEELKKTYLVYTRYDVKDNSNTV